MADVYASPLGTAIVQMKDIPPRPSSLDGCVLACAVSSAIEDATLRGALEAFGQLASCERLPNLSEVRAQYVTHEAALAAAAHEDHATQLGQGAFVCVLYNERPYGQRGWCVAEEMFSTECLRLPLPTQPRRKCVCLLSDGSAVEKTPGSKRTMRDVEERIRQATFTGKGDQKTVLQIYLTYQRRLDHAALIM